MKYKTANGKEKSLGEFGKSTRNEFDEALASLPELIAQARAGNMEAGQTANSLLWKLANESFNTYKVKDFECFYSFGKGN